MQVTASTLPLVVGSNTATPSKKRNSDCWRDLLIFKHKALHTLQAEDILNVLRTVSFFSSLNDEQLMLLCDGLDLISCHSGERIFEKGDSGSSLYVILNGGVRIHDGTHEFAQMKAGSYFGEYALFDRQERSATVTAQGSTTLLGIPRERFLEMLRNDPSFSQAIFADLIARHRELDITQQTLSLTKQQLEEASGRLESLIQSATDLIVLIDGRGIIQLINAAGCEVLANQDPIGRSLLHYMSEESSERLEVLLKSDLMGPQYIQEPIVLIGSDEQSATFEATLARVEGTGESYVIILRNIEDRIQAVKTIDDLTSKNRYMTQQIDELRGNYGLIAAHPSMLEVIAKMEQVAVTDATVLITGETGTGKELIASGIHQASDRAERPLVRVNCGAIPEALIESELFGHVKGAFTGATQDRQGRFAMADGGTIFLDEIGELPLSMQPKLLRVLQEGTFEAVGSNETKKVDVRIVAATHRDLLERAREGAFREDLYYRLHVFPIAVPALRDRGTDVLLIAEKMIQSFAKKMRKAEIEIDPTAAELLQQYPWPGNVRELQNLIERAMILSKDGTAFWPVLFPKTTVADTPTAKQAGVLTQGEMRELEKENILNALKQCRWKVSGSQGAARLLDMAPTTLQSRIKALGIRRPE